MQNLVKLFPSYNPIFLRGEVSFGFPLPPGPLFCLCRGTFFPLSTKKVYAMILKNKLNSPQRAERAPRLKKIQIPDTNPAKRGTKPSPILKNPMFQTQKFGNWNVGIMWDLRFWTWDLKFDVFSAFSAFSAVKYFQEEEPC